ncbi:hypothetical protein FOXG_22218 [Fusarium oxysporum f. sp. lycopersici 4287]|uniref:Uncharacterized protein n=1 Tax=Fusarium oxysporum f. sp. lycopersici (strain 4287 / CBS 123668 / FGSC 9935 / NRRL 34936) TaxID=426428 RepID=A0A0J9W532_FUSO4|nr:hypothetical protein FOXG_22090 [Fusarium oxysporum f. sp. lycopersici 4287]XP_018256443.1 uncharacterized protein FOXG_22218 [Fusarium oxysporum f. sp. lycopersici 4287]KNB17886.1 hypothetical protein FOXG_22090 [Fusarium oxysporum f. sp. lycopersici 4287]KNB18398.1 hypothetical protein FOXG_22218 [Fusarium oxysporum f. sp. lycopersici 4287]
MAPEREKAKGTSRMRSKPKDRKGRGHHPAIPAVEFAFTRSVAKSGKLWHAMFEFLLCHQQQQVCQQTEQWQQHRPRRNKHCLPRAIIIIIIILSEVECVTVDR